MNIICKNIQESLADLDLMQLEQPGDFKEHLDICSECTQYYHSLLAIHKASKELPEYDAADDTVSAAIEKVSELQRKEPRPKTASVKFNGFFKRLVAALQNNKDRIAAILVVFGILIAGWQFIKPERSGYYSNDTIVYNDDTLPSLINTTLTYIEGSFGALLMLASGILAIFLSGRGRYRHAGAFLSLALLLFFSRSITSTFFNDMNISDGGSYSSRRSYRATPYNYKRHAGSGDLGAEESYRDIVTAYSSQLKKLEERAKRAEDNANKLAKNQIEFEERTAEIFKKVIERMADAENYAANARKYEEQPIDMAVESLDEDDATFGDVDLAEAEIPEDPDNPWYKRGKEYVSKPYDEAQHPAAERAIGGKRNQQSRQPTDNNIWNDQSGGAQVINRGVRQNLPEAREKQEPSADQEPELSKSDAKELVYEPPLIDVTDIPPGLEAEGQYYRPAHQDIIEIRPGRWRYYKLPEGKAKSKKRARKASETMATYPREVIGESPNPLNAFFTERNQVEGLAFKDPNSYWANTYVPGDPTLRKLYSDLLGKERWSLKRFSTKSLRLDDAARRPLQPFDSPENSALQVYLHADKRGITEKSRMLLQVGIQGTRQHGRSRPAMNVGIVVDMRGNHSSQRQKMIRSLVRSFEKHREIGDRFSLTIAGKAGGTIIKSGDFKHGPVTIALQDLFGGQKIEAKSLSLVEAVNAAAEAVRGLNDESAPLGSSLVVLITDRKLGNQADALNQIAHKNAVAGIPFSVIGFGKDIDPKELDQLTLAGQGNRRFLDNAAEAQNLVQRELSAVSRVIARALRLRIRLAPGVKLVDVIGSHSLTEEKAEKVRQAERSIDQRMAKNLGIDADRGEDEEGVQIVIPAFYAGDSHVVLLDLVVPGPGAIADVRLRYKDLVYLRNGVSSTHLSIGRDQAAAGSLELNVLKNLLAQRLSAALKAAGDALSKGKKQEALMFSAQYIELLKTLQQSLPQLSQDQDLAADIAMLEEYHQLLISSAKLNPSEIILLSNSLRLASKLKVLPRPVVNMGDKEK